MAFEVFIVVASNLRDRQHSDGSLNLISAYPDAISAVENFNYYLVAGHGAFLRSLAFHPALLNELN